MFAQKIKTNKPDGKQSYLKAFLTNKETRLFMLLIAMIAIMGFLRPDTFFTSRNLFTVLRQISLVTIVAVSQTLIIISGGIDLSVGFSLGLSGIVISFLLDGGVSLILSILAGLLVGVLVGLSNGLIITLIKLPPFIVTIGMAYIARGLAFVITEGFTIRVTNDFISEIANGYVGPIPIMTIIMFAVVVIFSFILNRTAFGMKTKAVGGNITAAKLSGVNTVKHRIMIHVIGGLLCGLAGLLMIGRLNAGNPNAGMNYDVDSIAATVVGGTSMNGGEGSILGTLLGAMILGVMRNALVLLKVSMYWQTVVAGAVIITVCSIDHMTKKEK
ncbi:MAG: ABC transporter permease [Clostridiaceae bacterium]|jgi:ribose transport system permease protein|nr:ABC transporter permease [Clostridiaceae bacterium]